MATTRLLLWELGPVVITRRGIWTRGERTLLDVMEPRPEFLDECRGLIRENGRIHQRMFPGREVEVTEEVI